MKKPAQDEKDVMAAVTFAEVGEWDTARRYAGRPGKARLQQWVERHLVAAALAEEGLHDEALRACGAAPPPRTPSADTLALDVLLAARGVRMFCGVASAAALSGRR